MPEHARPIAKRLQRPSWRDSRLVVGLLLVVVAAALGAKAVASADDRMPVWVASTDLVAGDRIEAASLARADVRLADGMARYLEAASPPPIGSMVVRDVRAGELVPSSALGGADAVQVQRVTIRSEAQVAAGLSRGSRVDVYVTPQSHTGSTGAAGATTRLLRSAAVAAVLNGGSGFGTAETSSVQIYVPTDHVQDLVEAVDADSKITLVPAVGALGAGAS
ncbi:SAF domain-containing protein [Monashia sp. NPDC004114]